MCKEYIEREAAYAAVRESVNEFWRQLEINIRIDEIPAADVEPVVRGKWIERQYPLPLSDGSKKAVECSVCLTHWDGTSNYCPNCGAKMQGGKDE